MSESDPVLCFGEIVWDALPEGIFMGGAPLNVAYHLTRLGQAVYPVSRIGRDFLGEQTLRRLKSNNVSTELIQVDAQHATGAVVISLDADRNASYEILNPVAWDFIESTKVLMERALKAKAIVYGSLATRSTGNAGLLSNLLELVPLRVCDINLRKPYDDRENALKWASHADILKLNDEELSLLTPDPHSGSREAQVASLASTAGLDTIVLTCGGDGAGIWHKGAFVFHEARAVEVADTVGAGDAFTAGFLNAWLSGQAIDDCLSHALDLGGYVASQRGAQPEYDPTRFGA